MDKRSAENTTALPNTRNDNGYVLQAYLRLQQFRNHQQEESPYSAHTAHTSHRPHKNLLLRSLPVERGLPGPYVPVSTFHYCWLLNTYTIPRIHQEALACTLSALPPTTQTNTQKNKNKTPTSTFTILFSLAI